jgi:hypothetical protein
MNKINLIIDALNGCKGFTLFDDVAITEALAAARELKALKPLAYYNKRYDTVITAYELGNHVGDYDVPLYSLEVTK